MCSMFDLYNTTLTGHNQSTPTQCLGCPSHNAKFKKRFNCVKMEMFHAMIFVMGGANCLLNIYRPDFLVINTSYIIKN